MMLLKCSLFQGHAERQVLVRNYETGKSVAFDQRIRNLKAVYTSDGDKMYVSLVLLFFFGSYFGVNLFCSSIYLVSVDKCMHYYCRSFQW